jgi:hypothetical protein
VSPPLIRIEVTGFAGVDPAAIGDALLAAAQLLASLRGLAAAGLANGETAVLAEGGKVALRVIPGGSLLAAAADQPPARAAA